jgi:hypothetical protein
MAKQMSVMRFGQYKGQRIEEVPTSYLIWVFGSFPKLRNGPRDVLRDRGLSPQQIEQKSGCHAVLGKYPESSEKRITKRWRPKRIRRNDEQKRANDAARAMGIEVPYPRFEQPRELAYFQKRGRA